MATRTSAFRRIPFPLHDPDLRVSDAERSEVAERLGTHYSDGRLDQDEFNERVDRAMNAKTQSDLAGLFDDLPPIQGPDLPVPRPRRRNHRGALLLALVVIFAVTVGHAFWWFFMPPWLAVALLAVVGIYVLHGRDHHHHGRSDHHDHSGHHDRSGRRP